MHFIDQHVVLHHWFLLYKLGNPAFWYFLDLLRIFIEIMEKKKNTKEEKQQKWVTDRSGLDQYNIMERDFIYIEFC